MPDRKKPPSHDARPIFKPGVPAAMLIRALHQAETIITRTLRPACDACGGRMVWTATPLRGRDKGGPTNAERDGAWKGRALRAEDELRAAMEGAGSWAERAIAAEKKSEELEAALASSGRPGRQAEGLLFVRRLLDRLSRPDCVDCKRDLDIEPHRDRCKLADAIRQVDQILDPADGPRVIAAPREVVAAPSRVRAVPEENTQHGKIRAAVVAGKLPPTFDGAMVAELLGIERKNGAALLSRNAVGNRGGGREYFVRLPGTRGIYRLMEG